MKVDSFTRDFPDMPDFALGVKWTNFMQRTRKGGKKVWRASTFEECMYVSEFYNMCEKRIVNSSKGDKRHRDEWMNKVVSDIHRCLLGKEVEPFEEINTEIIIDGHKLARYAIKPFADPQFTIAGTVFKATDDGIKRVGGKPWVCTPKAQDHDKLYGGNCANPDGTLKEECDDYVDDTVSESWKTQDAREIIQQKYDQSKEAMQDAIKDDVPFSMVDSDKPSDKPNTDKTNVVKLSKAEQKELDSFGLTLDNIPEVGKKPSGFRKKLWKQIHTHLLAVIKHRFYRYQMSVNLSTH